MGIPAVGIPAMANAAERDALGVPQLNSRSHRPVNGTIESVTCFSVGNFSRTMADLSSRAGSTTTTSRRSPADRDSAAAGEGGTF